MKAEDNLFSCLLPFASAILPIIEGGRVAIIERVREKKKKNINNN